VKDVADGFGVTVETKALVDDDTADSATATDYECAVVDTNRDYDNDAEDIFGQGYFILEVTATQIVYVTATAGSSPLPHSVVTDIVEAGFDRGTGGRVRFRSKLQREPGFSTVLDIVILDGKLSSPQVAPSILPSASPTAVPSLVPPPLPTDSPTTRATPSPTASIPTTAPSNGRSPTAHPITIEPSTAAPTASSPPPSAPSLAQSPSSNKDRRPVILGAIAGGIATIIVSLFFIFCVWFPLCHPSKDGDENDSDTQDGDSRGKRCPAPNASPRSIGGGSTIVPGVVRLDEENESLANTTLGDVTDPRRQQHSITIAKKRPPTGVFDSFDENSIFTSGADNNNDASQGAVSSMVLPPSLSRTLEYEDDIIFPPSESVTTTSSADGTGGGILDMAASSSSSKSSSENRDTTARDDVVVQVGYSTNTTSNSPSSLVDTTDTVKSDENLAKQVAQSINSGTKGYDPFGEDTSGSSSFEFESSSLEDMGEGRPGPYEPSEVSSSSPVPGIKTKPANRSRQVDPVPGDRQRLISPTEEEKREVQDEMRDYPEYNGHYSPEKISSRAHPSRSAAAHEEKSSSPAEQDNNSLLRNILEDARRLSQSKSSSNRSKLSRKSAPSRVPFKKPKSRREVVQPPQDILADNYDLEEYISKQRASPKTKLSSKSVGAALPSSRQVFREETPSKSSEKKAKDRNGAAQGNQAAAKTNPYRTRYLGTGNRADPNQYLPRKPAHASTPEADKNSRDRTGTPSSSQPSPPGTLGAEPREDGARKAGQSLPDTPASSPGVLGITVSAPKDGRVKQDDASSESEGMSNPWLFDAIEQTLGPRSPAADMESISGRSNRSGKSIKSNRSGKSHKSHRSQRSNPTATHGGNPPVASRDATPLRSNDPGKDRARQSMAYSRSSTAAPVVDGSLGEHKTSSSDEPITPRTLEYDLRRLEVQLGDARRMEVDQTTTTSSITASSAGASRSTLSSKRLRRNKKKRLVIVVPPGKLGVVLADRHDGKGTVVSEIRASSAINGMLSPGDKLGK